MQEAAAVLHERRQRETAMAIAGRLASDVSVYAARAELLLTRGDALAAHRLCTTIMRRDPLCTECMDVHLACLVELGKKNDLFEFGHRCDVRPATFWAGVLSACVLEMCLLGVLAIRAQTSQAGHV